MNVIEMLESQHRETEALLDALLGAASTADRRELLRRAAGDITKHAILEETYFYGSICQQGLEDLTHRARHQHEEIKYLLEDLSNLAPDAPAFLDKVRALSQRIHAHVQEEETVLFPRAQAQCDARTLDDMGRAMEESSHVWEENEPRESAVDLPSPA